MPERERATVQGSAHVMLRPLANPIPLGFLALGVAIALVTLDLPAGANSDALGVLLVAAAVALAIPAAGAALGKLAVAAVLATAAIRFATTGIYELTAARPGPTSPRSSAWRCSRSPPTWRWR